MPTPMRNQREAAGAACNALPVPTRVTCEWQERQFETGKRHRRKQHRSVGAVSAIVPATAVRSGCDLAPLVAHFLPGPAPQFVDDEAFRHRQIAKIPDAHCRQLAPLTLSLPTAAQPADERSNRRRVTAATFSRRSAVAGRPRQVAEWCGKDRIAALLRCRFHDSPPRPSKPRPICPIWVRRRAADVMSVTSVQRARLLSAHSAPTRLRRPDRS